MMNNLEKVKEKLKLLVTDFKDNNSYYKKLSEADVEDKLVNELFVNILGWDKKDYEKRAKVRRGDKGGSADYAFKINDRIVFFLEVKKVTIPLDKEADEQVISYALSKKIPFAVSTNFEQLKIFCVEESEERKVIFRAFSNPDDYLTKFDDLLLLSKDSFEQGLLLKEAVKEERLKKRVSIDKVLLEDFWRVRTLIANDIEKNKSGKYNINEKDEIVQRILDRLIFIRKCEDMGINPENLTLEEIKHVAESRAYSHLKTLFSKYDQVYNSGLFTPNKDNDCDSITINGEIIQTLIGYLYESHDKKYKYNFEWIDADVLGQVYEQYLGKILAQTKSGKAKLKEGQAHRKEQGIYYTPTYIVDYIIKNTLGELLKDKKVDTKKIKILDPACGSGSFLIKAFDYLNEHLSKDSDTKQHKLDFQGAYSVKTSILKNNIYGVDLDNKAVEITKLNLLLKAAEKFRKLPSELDNHIGWGNSLIDDDAFEHPFKWTGDFQEGTFDVVVGNPPYFNLEMLSDEETEFLKKYECYAGKSDILYYFYNKGIHLLKEGGILGFITSRYFIEATHARNLRKYILNNCNILRIIDLSKLEVFKYVGIHTVIIILEKGQRKNNKISYQEVLDFNNINNNVNLILQSSLSEDSWVLGEKNTLKIYNKIEKSTQLRLKEISIIEQGQKSGLNEAFTVDEKIIKEYKLEKEFIRKLVKNSHIHSYNIEERGLFLIYASEKMNPENAPKIVNYLEKFKKSLKARAEACDELYSWYRLQRPRDQSLFDSTEKIVVPYRAEYNKFAYDDLQRYNDGGDIRIIVISSKEFSTKYILAILNSKLMNFYYKNIGRKKGRVYEYFVEPLQKIPILKISLEKQNSYIKLVDKMILMKQKLAFFGDKNTSETAKLEDDIEKTDNEIDELVYKLYGITEAEKKIIEESLR